jgi:glucose/arabinose dehydrogenase
MIVSDAVESYLLESRRSPDAVLAEMEEHGHRDRIPIVMPPTGALLAVLTAASGARRVVEVGTACSGYHNGGQLFFLGGKLFVTVGEAHDPANAQRLSTRLGKVLRYNPDGSIPADNPVLGGHRTAIWSYGHRNGFGLTAKPHTKLLYETENGPNCDDELNRIMRGRNYGWGNGYVCGTNGVGPNPVAPLKRWTPTIAPTDPWWYTGRITRMRGSIYMGDYNTGSLRRPPSTGLSAGIEPSGL